MTASHCSMQRLVLASWRSDMRKEDRCIWDKFGKDDIARIVNLVERVDKVLEEERSKKRQEKDADTTR